MVDSWKRERPCGLVLRSHVLHTASLTDTNQFCTKLSQYRLRYPYWVQMGSLCETDAVPPL